jgi:tetratricopeptide (TPR) repeat protein
MAEACTPTLPPDAPMGEHTVTAGPDGDGGHSTHLFAPVGYELLDEIGTGGMGVVYCAREVALNRHVALKILHPRYPTDGPAARRFVDEAGITGQLQHPGIPPIHQVGTLENGRPFLAMKLIRGSTLEDLLKARSTPAEDRGRFLAVFEQVCHAVAFAHDRNVIHRDLKPANVMVGNYGEAQVMDWGLAKTLTCDRPADAATEADAPPGTEVRSLRDLESATQAGSMLGTPAFMPPEQAGGEIDKVNERSDVFGLGAVLCVILTGKPPYFGKDSEAVRLMAIRGQLDECTARLAACGVDPELLALCGRCLAREPADRPRHAGEVASAVADLRAAAEERARRAELDRVRAEGETRAAEVRSAEQRKRRRVQGALGLSFTGLVVLGGAFAWWQDRQAADRRAEQARAQADRATERGTERAAVEARARQAVESAAALAGEMRDKYRFAEAALALDQAAALVPPDAPLEITNRLAAARDDLAFVRELDEVRVSRIRSDFAIGVAAVPAAYAAAFRARGVDPTNPDPAAAGDWVAASPIKRHLVIALDDWAWTDHRGTTRERLLAVVRRADPGAWSDRLRERDVWTKPAELDELAAEFSPEVVPPNLLVLMFQMRQNAWPAGPKLLAAGTLRHPNDFWVQFEAGYYYYFKDSQPAVAIGHFRAARALRPDLPLVVQLLGGALNSAGKRDEAVACYREVTRLEPTNARAYTDLGHALRSHDPVEAKAAFRKAITLDPTAALAHGALGTILADQDDIDGAVAAFRQAATLEPWNSHWYDWIAFLLLKKGDAKGALTAATVAVGLNPKSGQARWNLGHARLDTGDLDGAIADFQEVIRLEPQHTGARPSLAHALALRANRTAPPPREVKHP